MKRLVVGVVVAACGAVIGWWCAGTEYRSVAVLEVVPPDLVFVSHVNGPASEQVGERAWRASQVALFSSRRIAVLALNEVSWKELGAAERTMTSDEFLTRLNVSQRRGQYLVDIVFEHPDPAVARAAAASVSASCVDAVNGGGEMRGRLRALGARAGELTSEIEDLTARRASATRDGGVGDSAAEAEAVRLEDARAQVRYVDERIVQLREESESHAAPRAQLVSPASTPTAPYRRSGPALAALGGLIGLVLGIGSTVALKR